MFFHIIAIKPFSLRLQGPFSANGAGRIEVFYNGTWGTICDRGWDIRDARVVCRQLGYEYAVKTFSLFEVSWMYRLSSGPIWLRDVSCAGSERNISRCSHSGWGVHDCRHFQDAGVQCSTTGKE